MPAKELPEIIESVKAVASAVSPTSGSAPPPALPAAAVAIFSGKSADAKRKQRAIVRALIADRHDPDSIAIILDIPVANARRLYNDVLKEETETLVNRDAGEVYAEYRMRMLQCAADLDHVRRDTEVAAVKVGAVKAKANIFDRVIDKGQELGVVESAPGKLMVGTVDLSGATDDEIRRRVFGEVKAARSIMAAGEGDLLALPQPDIYEDAPRPRVKPPRRRKA